MNLLYRIFNVIIVIRSGRARVMLPNSHINFKRSKLYCQKCACLHIAHAAGSKSIFTKWRSIINYHVLQYAKRSGTNEALVHWHVLQYAKRSGTNEALVHWHVLQYAKRSGTNEALVHWQLFGKYAIPRRETRAILRSSGLVGKVRLSTDICLKMKFFNYNYSRSVTTSMQG